MFGNFIKGNRERIGKPSIMKEGKLEGGEKERKGRKRGKKEKKTFRQYKMVQPQRGNPEGLGGFGLFAKVINQTGEKVAHNSRKP